MPLRARQHPNLAYASWTVAHLKHLTKAVPHRAGRIHHNVTASLLQQPRSPQHCAVQHTRSRLQGSIPCLLLLLPLLLLLLLLLLVVLLPACRCRPYAWCPISKGPKLHCVQA
jgi:hypothetical protein